MKAKVMKLTKEQHSGWEVYVPARLSTTGKRERKRFNLKADATQYAAELNIKIESEAIAPLGSEYHITTAEFQSKLTPEQFREALVQYHEELEAKTMSLGQLIDLYTKDLNRLHKRGECGKTHLDDVVKRLKTFQKWVGDPMLSKITSEWVEDFIDSRLDANASPRTVWNYCAKLSATLNFAVKKGILKKNVVNDVRLPSKKSEVKIMTPEDLQILLEHSTHYPRVYMMFGAFGGLRSSEINVTSWDDIDLEANQVYVPGKKNAHAERWVELTPPLRAYCELMLKSDNPPSGLLMPICDSTFRNHLNKLYAETDGLRIPQNALRHSYASHHLVAYGDPTLTATEMGHLTPQTTYAHYRKAVKKQQALKFWNIRWVPEDGEDLMAVAA